MREKRGKGVREGERRKQRFVAGKKLNEINCNLALCVVSLAHAPKRRRSFNFIVVVIKLFSLCGSVYASVSVSVLVMSVFPSVSLSVFFGRCHFCIRCAKKCCKIFG